LKGKGLGGRALTGLVIAGGIGKCKMEIGKVGITLALSPGVKGVLILG
jgi:hypothetical protein